METRRDPDAADEGIIAQWFACAVAHGIAFEPASALVSEIMDDREYFEDNGFGSLIRMIEDAEAKAARSPREQAQWEADGKRRKF